MTKNELIRKVTVGTNVLGLSIDDSNGEIRGYLWENGMITISSDFESEEKAHKGFDMIVTSKKQDHRYKQLANKA